MPKYRILLVSLALALATASLCCAVEATGVPRQKAEALFRRYVELEHNFDPAMADLYSDTAQFKVTLVSPQGSKDVQILPAPQRKAQIRKVMPLAKRLRDLSFYTEEKYEQEGNFVRIKVKRYAELYKFSSPLELLVGPGPKGDWLVLEEVSEQHQQPGRGAHAAPPAAPAPH